MFMLTSPSHPSPPPLRGRGGVYPIPGANIQPGALVGGALAHVRIRIGAEHIDRPGDSLVVWALAWHQDDAGLYFVADVEHQADLATVVQQADARAIGEIARLRVGGVQHAEWRALASAQE